MSIRHGRLVRSGLLISLLAGCAHGPDPRPAEPQVVYKEVPVAVAVGCVKDRPAKPASIKSRLSRDQWNKLATGAQAEQVVSQAGARLNYEDALNASTAGCPDVGTPPGTSTGH